MPISTSGRTPRIAAVLALCVLASCALAGGASAALPAHGPIGAVGIDGIAVNGTASNATAANATNATLVVRGATNRQPGETAVLLSLRATNGTTTRLATADSWGWDGEWSAAFDLGGVPPGAYRVEATTGDDTDVVDVRLGSDSGANGTASNVSAITVH